MIKQYNWIFGIQRLTIIKVEKKNIYIHDIGVSL